MEEHTIIKLDSLEVKDAITSYIERIGYSPLEVEYEFKSIGQGRAEIKAVKVLVEK